MNGLHKNTIFILVFYAFMCLPSRAMEEYISFRIAPIFNLTETERKYIFTMCDSSACRGNKINIWYFQLGDSIRILQTSVFNICDDDNCSYSIFYKNIPVIRVDHVSKLTYLPDICVINGESAQRKLPCFKVYSNRGNAIIAMKDGLVELEMSH